MVAARQDPLAAHTVGPDGYHPSTSGWHRLDPLRTSRGGPWKRRSHGKPNTGFPPLLGNRLRRFPLFHRHDDYESSLSQTKGEEGSMITRPDNSRINKTGQLQKLTTPSAMLAKPWVMTRGAGENRADKPE